MGGRSKNFRCDEWHTLNFNETLCQYGAPIAHENLIVLLFLFLFFPPIHPVREFPGAEEIIVNFVSADPLGNGATINMFDLVLDTVFFENFLASLNNKIAVPIINAQQNPLAWL